MGVGWWYERCMFHNLNYTHGDWLVVCLTIYITNTEATVSWTSSWGIKLKASNEDKGGEGKGSDYEDGQKLPGREARSIELEGQSLILSHCCSQSWRNVFKPLARAQCTSILNAAHWNSACSPLLCLCGHY